MNLVELRDLERGQIFLAQSVWLQRTAPISGESVPSALEWALAVGANGDSAPPLGFIADLGWLLLNPATIQTRRNIPVAAPSMPDGLLRAYEDYVLGRLLANASIDRVADSLRRYQGPDQMRALAFVVERLRERTKYAGIVFNPAALRRLMDKTPEEVLQQGWRSFQKHGPLPELVTCYQSLVKAFRGAAEMLASEDLFELERGTALTSFSQRLAIRQVLAADRALNERLAVTRPALRTRPRDTAANILADDVYPVGGFAELSTRGSVESLLQSQLALMEPSDRPDLFDVKYLRNELLYYSRDENALFRRRRTFVFALCADLVAARCKDASLPWQRIIMLLALFHVVVDRLTEWLSDDALRFEFVLVEEERHNNLQGEREILEAIFRNQIERGMVCVSDVVGIGDFAAVCEAHKSDSSCHIVTAAMQFPLPVPKNPDVIQLCIADPLPLIAGVEVADRSSEATEPFAEWVNVAQVILGDLVQRD